MGLYYLYIQDSNYHTGKEILYGKTHELYKNNWYKPGPTFRDIVYNHDCKKLIMFPLHNYKKIKIIHENPYTKREESEYLEGDNLTSMDLALKSLLYYKKNRYYSDEEFEELCLIGWDIKYTNEMLICSPIIFE